MVPFLWAFSCKMRREKRGSSGKGGGKGERRQKKKIKVDIATKILIITIAKNKEREGKKKKTHTTKPRPQSYGEKMKNISEVSPGREFKSIAEFYSAPDGKWEVGLAGGPIGCRHPALISIIV